MSDIRDLVNNNRLRLSFYDRGGYNKDTSISLFSEFMFDSKPLLKSVNTKNSTVESVMNTVSFKNSIEIIINNPTVSFVASETDITSSNFWTHYSTQVDIKKDFIFMLYYDDDNILFTGVVTNVTTAEEQISLTLESRVSELAFNSGLDTKTTLAGWEEKLQFNDALKLMLENNDIEYTGDVDAIDYENTLNEGDPDVRPFDNSAGIYLYDDENIIVSTTGQETGEYGQKYNFITNTIETFNSDNIVHFSFKSNDGNTYFVIEKPTDVAKRIGQYAKLYLVEESNPTVYNYMGVGRISETINQRVNDIELNYTQMENYVSYDTYVIDNRIEYYASELWKAGEGDDVYHYGDHNYHYRNTESGGGGGLGIFVGFLGQVVSLDNYYCPIFSWSKSSNYLFSVHIMTRMAGSTKQFEGVLNLITVIGADLNSNYIDDFNKIGSNNFENIYKDGSLSRSKQNESVKSRSYFAWDSVNDRVVFQRASDTAPSGSSYDIGDDLTKTWDNFGLNPIGYISMSDFSLGYLDKKNDDFIHDMVFQNNNLFAVMITPENMNYTISTSLFYASLRVLNGNTFEEIKELEINNGYVPYGLHAYNKNTIDYISFVIAGGISWYHYKINIDDYTDFELKELGTLESLTAITGSVIDKANSDLLILLMFVNGQLYFRDIENETNTIYRTANLPTDKMGGYIVPAINTDDFTAKFEDNVLTFVSQVRGDLIDLKDKNLLQGLLMLTKMANKFIFVNNRDTLVFKNKANMLNNSITLTDVQDVEILDAEEYKSVEVASYYYDETELFKATATQVQYDGEVSGTWNGLDASFTMHCKANSSTSLTYTANSTSEFLTIEETTITLSSLSEWQNIVINVTHAGESDSISLGFSIIPTELTEFDLIFNSKTLKKADVNTQFTDSESEYDETKTIDVRFVDRNMSTQLLNDITGFFIGQKRVFSVTTLDPYFDLDCSKSVFFTYYFLNLINIECYIKSYSINTNNTTTFLLKEV